MAQSEPMKMDIFDEYKMMLTTEKMDRFMLAANIVFEEKMKNVRISMIDLLRLHVLVAYMRATNDGVDADEINDVPIFKHAVSIVWDYIEEKSKEIEIPDEIPADMEVKMCEQNIERAFHILTNGYPDKVLLELIKSDVPDF